MNGIRWWAGTDSPNLVPHCKVIPRGRLGAAPTVGVCENIRFPGLRVLDNHIIQYQIIRLLAGKCKGAGALIEKVKKRIALGTGTWYTRYNGKNRENARYTTLEG